MSCWFCLTRSKHLPLLCFCACVPWRPHHGDIVSTYNEEPEEGCFFQPKYNTQIYNNSTLYPVPSQKIFTSFYNKPIRSLVWSDVHQRNYCQRLLAESSSCRKHAHFTSSTTHLKQSVCYDGMPVITIATDLSQEIEAKYQPIKQLASQSILK